MTTLVGRESIISCSVDVKLWAPLTCQANGVKTNAPTARPSPVITILVPHRPKCNPPGSTYESKTSQLLINSSILLSLHNHTSTVKLTFHVKIKSQIPNFTLVHPILQCIAPQLCYWTIHSQFRMSVLLRKYKGQKYKTKKIKKIK